MYAAKSAGKGRAAFLEADPVLVQPGTRKSSHSRDLLRTFTASLRKKLEEDPSHPRHLITEPGVGYRFVC